MKQLSIIALFLCASVCSFAQCSTSLFNTIAHLEGLEPSQMTKTEFRVLAVKYAAIVGEHYDMTAKNARIAQKLCGLLAERQTINTCNDLLTTNTNQVQKDSFVNAYIDTLQNDSITLYFDSLVFNDVEPLQATSVQDTSTQTNIGALERVSKPTQYAPIKYVLQQLRKEGYSPKEARCEVKTRIQANNGLKFDYKLGIEVSAKGLERVKCDKPQKKSSSLKSKKSSRGGAKFKVKVRFLLSLLFIHNKTF